MALPKHPFEGLSGSDPEGLRHKKSVLASVAGGTAFNVIGDIVAADRQSSQRA
jgi:hypothetical protein